MEESVIKKKSGSKLRKYFRTIVLFAFALIAILIYWNYFNVKSNGDRKGVLIKFSHKGNVFKTDEGEMWLGCRQTVNAEKYFFSVTNDSIASILRNLQDECGRNEARSRSGEADAQPAASAREHGIHCR